LNYTVSITDGLKNPLSAPYSIKGWIIEIRTERGYVVDSWTQGEKESIEVLCEGGCATCSERLDKCNSCINSRYL